MSYTQEGRLFKLNTPLGENVLLLKDITGEEGISTLFSFKLNLLSENHSIAFEDIIGQSVTVSIKYEDDRTRYINGIVSEFSQSRGGVQGTADVLLSYYTLTIVPKLWLLTRTTNCRIFQNKTVRDIVSGIFDEKSISDYEANLTGTYVTREYCVQYRETDFDFISRLLEEEGIFYFFRHEDGKHTLILADGPSQHQACPEQGTARCRPHEGGTYDEDMVDTLEVKKEIQVGKYALKDYNFETPNTDLRAEVSSSVTLGPGDREYYDYPGGYGNMSDGRNLVNIRIQAEEARITTLHGASNCRAFTSGYKFRLEEFYRNDMNNTEYVLTGIRHEGNQTYPTGDAQTEQSYKNEFTCIPFAVSFRPQRLTRKPRIEGVQTAIVVGSSGEEIDPDRYGRVKVQFHWDREGQNDENSSCFIRVGQVLAGTGWGAMFIPRKGQEVIVEFLEGDPDKPIIVGCVYHGLNNPPYALPDEKTKSTIKTDSSKGGGGFNEIRFEDKKGEEQLFINAQKNQDNRVGNDSMETVGGSRHLVVNGEQRELVKKDKHLTVKGKHKEKVEGDTSLALASNFFETIGGDHNLIVKGDQLEKVEGTEHLHVKTDYKEKVDLSKDVTVGLDHREKVGMDYIMDAGMMVHIKAGMQMVIETGMEVTLKGPGGFIDIGPAGVTIQGTMVLINSGGAAGSMSGSDPRTPSDASGGDAPELPQQADTAEPGERPTDPAQVQALRDAAASGLGGCPN
ncbi:MAG: type VI secretion system tip protein TssI/VgrG [Syntrophaceae bacterium]